MGSDAETSPPLERDAIVVIETNLDNATGELLGWLMDHLLDAGALDVSYQAIQMKKNRPGTLVRVIARPEDAERLAAAIIRATPTLGVRLMPMQRLIAARRQATLDTPFGPVQFKLKLLGGKIVSAAPEYEEAKRLAAASGLPLTEVMARLDAWAHEEYGEE